MKHWVKFKNLTRADKIFWILNLLFSLLMSAVCVGLAIYYGFFYNWNNRLGSAVGMIFASLIPIIFELITRRRLPNTVFLAVNIYILFAGVIGSALNVYYLVSFYDIIIHTIMGYAIAMIALFLLCRMGEHKKMKIITIAMFCLFFSLGIELLWEIFERGLDVFFGQTAQGIKVEGTNSPLVSDTIEDLICNFSGAIAFFIHFVVDGYTKLNLGFKYILKDFSGDRFNERYSKILQKPENHKNETVLFENDLKTQENVEKTNNNQLKKSRTKKRE